MEDYQKETLGRSEEALLLREIICEYMKGNRDFALGKFEGVRGMALRKLKWKDLAEKLENVHGIERSAKQCENVSRFSIIKTFFSCILFQAPLFINYFFRL